MQDILKKFSYHLPESLIANTPASPRDSAKLMVIDRSNGQITQHVVSDLPKLINKDTVIVFNNTKVFPARLYGKKTTGGNIELLLLNPLSEDTWSALTKPSLKKGQKLSISSTLKATVIEESQQGVATIRFNHSGTSLMNAIYELGHTPLPPYIDPKDSEESVRKKYQTTYALKEGSVAAPTAGLHFTKKLLSELQRAGIQLEYITLHVGLGTFLPLKYGQLKSGSLHHEQFEIAPQTAERLNQAKEAGKKIIAVGTTTTRTLESCTNNKGELIAQTGSTDLFIKPPYSFKFVDHLLTNFHLPESSLLMLVSAFTSQPNTKEEFTTFKNSLIGKAYQQAIEKNYRFYSFGDTMLIR